MCFIWGNRVYFLRRFPDNGGILKGLFSFCGGSPSRKTPCDWGISFFLVLAGEGMTDASFWLQVHPIGLKLLTPDEPSKWVAYLPTPTQFDYGGYSGSYRVARRRAKAA